MFDFQALLRAFVLGQRRRATPRGKVHVQPPIEITPYATDFCRWHQCPRVAKRVKCHFNFVKYRTWSDLFDSPGQSCTKQRE